MTITRLGATRKYADNWEHIFGGKRRSATGSSATKAKGKKSAKKKVAARKAKSAKSATKKKSAKR
jgi:hypothetical protein